MEKKVCDSDFFEERNRFKRPESCKRKPTLCITVLLYVVSILSIYGAFCKKCDRKKSQQSKPNKDLDATASYCLKIVGEKEVFLKSREPDKYRYWLDLFWIGHLN